MIKTTSLWLYIYIYIYNIYTFSIRKIKALTSSYSSFCFEISNRGVDSGFDHITSLQLMHIFSDYVYTVCNYLFECMVISMLLTVLLFTSFCLTVYCVHIPVGWMHYIQLHLTHPDHQRYSTIIVTDIIIIL